MNFVNLPKDILNIIVEYVPVEDYTSLQLTNKQINEFFKNKPELWAKKIFSLVINPGSRRNGGFMLEEEINKRYQPTESEYRKFKNAEFLWKQASAQTSQFSKFLGTVLGDAQEGQNMVDQVIKGLMNPSLPAPNLKRDIHFFPTETEFQNFLTEKFFNIKSNNLFDCEVKVTEKVCKFICKTSSTENAILPLARWYQKEAFNAIEFAEQNIEISALETLLSHLNNMFDSYCQFVLYYLNSLNDDKVILKQYYKCWEDFVIALIDTDRILAPVSQIVNEKYQEVYPDHPQFPSFSIWRMMAKAWYSIVYKNMAEKLGQGIKETIETLMKNAINKTQISSYSKYMVKKNEVLEVEVTEDDQEFEEEQARSLKLIKKFRRSIEDLSFNEYTVFYNDCDLPNEESPKFGMTNAVIDQIIQIFDSTLKTLSETPADFKNVYNCLQKLFGEALGQRGNIDLMARINEHLIQSIPEKKSSTNYGILKSFFEDMNGSLEKELEEFDNICHSRQDNGFHKVAEEFEGFFNLHQKAPIMQLISGH